MFFFHGFVGLATPSFNKPFELIDCCMAIYEKKDSMYNGHWTYYILYANSFASFFRNISFTFLGFISLMRLVDFFHGNRGNSTLHIQRVVLCFGCFWI